MAVSFLNMGLNPNINFINWGMRLRTHTWRRGRALSSDKNIEKIVKKRPLIIGGLFIFD